MQDYADMDDFITLYHSTEHICIFTGAGVSFTQDKRFRAPGWEKLLSEILLELLGASKQQESKRIFSGLKSKFPDFWDLATAVKAYAQNEKTFLKVLRKVVLKENESADSYGRLKTKNIDGATTLNAIIAFCSKIKEIRKHPCFAVNPKVKAVLTANYDPFLEAGATKKHESGLFKPMSRSSSTYKQGQLPVYHIHGYLPFGKKKAGEDQSSKIIPLPTEPLILDRESYERAYQVGSWTLWVLKHFLRVYSTLFIGFSFEDEYFLRELTRLSQDPHARVHYALLRQGDERPSGLLDELRHVNVRPVLYDEHDQIPSLLARTYQSILQRNDIRIPIKDNKKKLVDADQYWDMLWFDKRWKDLKSLREKANLVQTDL